MTTVYRLNIISVCEYYIRIEDWSSENLNKESKVMRLGEEKTETQSPFA